jgi:hypothetical protein
MSFVRRFPAIAAVVAPIQLACAAASFAQSSNLEVNPTLVRHLPPAGWVGDHRDIWIRDHAAYQANCQNPDVVGEIRFLNRIVGFDEYLLTTTHSSEQSDAAAEQKARQKVTSLRSDISATDGLVARLQALPACTDAAPSPTPASATAPPPAAPEAIASTPPPSPQPLVIRFDDHVAALTPSGIRAFKEAVGATRSGKKIWLAIDGCDAKADFSNGSACARRLASLVDLLADNGIRDPKRLFPDLH